MHNTTRSGARERLDRSLSEDGVVKLGGKLSSVAAEAGVWAQEGAGGVARGVVSRGDVIFVLDGV